MTSDAISLYIPARNAERTLAECIAAVRSQTRPPDELFIVVDPRSTDRTAEIARSSGVTVIEQRGASLGAARNQAIQAARHRWLACCDSDVILEPDWLARLAARRGEEAAGIGGRTVERVRSPFDDWRALHLPHHWGEHPFRNPFMLVSEVLFDRRALLAVGGYRDDLNYYEDSDLCQRLRDAGYDLFYEPAAIATHHRMDSLLSLLALRWKYSEYRQRHLLDTFTGLLQKTHVNREYALTTLSRSLARRREELTYISFLIFFHHLKADLHSMLSRRPLIPPEAVKCFENSLMDNIASALRPLRPELARTVLADLQVETTEPGASEHNNPPAWSTYLNGVQAAIDRLCEELSPKVLAITECSAQFVHEQRSGHDVQRLPRASREALQANLDDLPLTPLVDESFCRSIRDQWPDVEAVQVVGPLADREQAAIRNAFPRTTADPARMVILAAHLEADADPLRVYDELGPNVARLVVAYQPPGRFLPGLDLPSAGELASAAAAADWTLSRFDTLVGRTRLMLSRQTAMEKSSGLDEMKRKRLLSSERDNDYAVSPSPSLPLSPS